MSWIDVTLIVLIAISVASGIHEGFSRSGLGFLAVVIGLLSAAWLYPTTPAGFAMVFGGVVCAGWLAGFLLTKVFQSAGLGWLDRPLGGAFGLVNALLFWVVVAMALMAFAPKTPREYVANSCLAPYALEAACTLAEAAPDEMKWNVERSYEELVKVLPPRFRKSMPQVQRNEI